MLEILNILKATYTENIINKIIPDKKTVFANVTASFGGGCGFHNSVFLTFFKSIISTIFVFFSTSASAINRTRQSLSDLKQ